MTDFHYSSPCAIGNGTPLQNLNEGILPDKIMEYEKSIIDKVKKATQRAIDIHTESHKDIPYNHQHRTAKTLENLLDFQANIPEKIHLYNAVVDGPEDYLLGFYYNEQIGLSLELIEVLSNERLAQYIYHECVPEDDVVTREEHKVLYHEIQTPLFGAEEVKTLGTELRRFISS